MLVGCERNFFSEKRIGHSVIARVANDIQVLSSYSLIDDALCVTVGETRTIRLQDKRVFV